MEMRELLPYIKDHLPDLETLSDNADFKRFMNDNAEVAFNLVDLLQMTLPSPRDDFYMSTDFDVIKERVFSYTNEVIDRVDFFRMRTMMKVLDGLEELSMNILYIGLTAHIVVILFVTIAILLIYSLLMVSIETKTFEFGVMRLVGLSTRGLVSLIAIQAVLFVVPAIITAFTLSVPALACIYNLMATTPVGFMKVPIPSVGASLQALAIGLFIPAISAIIPI